jgi:hypothetical protein
MLLEISASCYKRLEKQYISGLSVEYSVWNFLMTCCFACSHTSIKVNVADVLSEMKHQYMKNIILFQIVM